MHQTCVRLEREASARPSPGPVLPPRPLPSLTLSSISGNGRKGRSGQPQKGRPAWDGSVARLVTEGEGKGPLARGAVSRRSHPACPRRPLVPSAMTWRAEQEGNRSRARRRRRLPAVQLPLPPPSARRPVCLPPA
uniref:SH3 domain binding glutamic acid-rich protein like 3 n=1 Tax=Pan troglodytes TaxID=9598 RepID=K7APB1_PANTR